MDTGAGAQSGGFRVLIGRENHLIGAPGSFSGTLDSAKLWQTADHAMMDSTLDQSRKAAKVGAALRRGDRKSTRLNSSHVSISYAVFCLKKKKTKTKPRNTRQTHT